MFYPFYSSFTPPKRCVFSKQYLLSRGFIIKPLIKRTALPFGVFETLQRVKPFKYINNFIYLLLNYYLFDFPPEEVELELPPDFWLESPCPELPELVPPLFELLELAAELPVPEFPVDPLFLFSLPAPVVELAAELPLEPVFVLAFLSVPLLLPSKALLLIADDEAPIVEEVTEG